jgi:cell division protein FtsB
MSYEPPMPPAELPADIVNTLNDYSPDQLQHVAQYAEALAKYKAREARLEEESPKDEVEERPDDLPGDIPMKATIKEINDNRYYYWQWREGNKIKSKYKAPVSFDE